MAVCVCVYDVGSSLGRLCLHFNLGSFLSLQRRWMVPFLSNTIGVNQQVYPPFFHVLVTLLLGIDPAITIKITNDKKITGYKCGRYFRGGSRQEAQSRGPAAYAAIPFRSSTEA